MTSEITMDLETVTLLELTPIICTIGIYNGTKSIGIDYSLRSGKMLGFH